MASWNSTSVGSQQQSTSGSSSASSSSSQNGSIGRKSPTVNNNSPDHQKGGAGTADLFELLERVQSSRLDDQRCALPAFFSQVCNTVATIEYNIQLNFTFEILNNTRGPYAYHYVCPSRLQ